MLGVLWIVHVWWVWVCKGGGVCVCVCVCVCVWERVSMHPSAGVGVLIAAVEAAETSTTSPNAHTEGVTGYGGTAVGARSRDGVGAGV